MFAMLSVSGLTDFAASGSVHTIAIISVDAGASGLVVDQLTAEMSSDPMVRLVERDTIKRLEQEQELSAMGLTSGSRVKLGQMLGANDLVLISKNPLAGTNSLRVLVCDCATGARIGQIRGATGAANVSSLAAEIKQVLARFPQGVQSVVAVPDFISEDLQLENAGLQTGLAELLRGVLAREPGLALVEFDEAKSLAGEHELTGGEVRRVMPLFVEGKYRTEEIAAGGPQISIMLSLRMTRHDDLKLESGQIPLNTAGKFIVNTVRAKVLDLLKLSVTSEFDAGQEFVRLIQRAEQFAEIADFDRSTELREAALLLKPDANDQRIRLVQEYSSANYQLVNAWPKGAQRSANDPFWVQLVAHRRETWRRSLSQVEYLVRNHCVDITLGSQLSGNAINSITSIRGTEGDQLTEEENLKKEFLLNVAPALLKLSGNNGQPASREQLSTAANFLCDNALFRLDGNYLKEEDLVLEGDLLCDLLSEDTPLSMNLIYRLTDGTRIFGGTSRDVTRHNPNCHH